MNHRTYLVFVVPFVASLVAFLGHGRRPSSPRGHGGHGRRRSSGRGGGGGDGGGDLLGDGADLVVALPVLVLAELAAVAGGVAAAARLGGLASAVPAVGLLKQQGGRDK